MLLLSSLCSDLEIICGVGAHFLQKYSLARFPFNNFTNSLADVFSSERLLCYEVTLVRKYNKPVPEQVK